MTLLRVPAVVASTTVSPPEVRALPLASIAWTVTVEVVTPSAVIDSGAAVSVVLAADAGPGVNVTVALSTTVSPSMVPVTVALPAVVSDVSVAE